MVKRFVASVMIIFGFAIAAGCHTVHGMGQDIESAGQSIERATDKK
jgi:predicted small secreted protein